jgi:DNA-binding transcriptional ArsR family regulator
MPRKAAASADAFKALGDPIRWSIVQQIAEQGELAASVLENTLPVSKPTISYHAKILTQAGLIAVRKRGRHYFYRLRPEVLHELLDVLWGVVPGPHAVDEPTSMRRSRRQQVSGPALKLASGDDTHAAPLTW